MPRILPFFVIALCLVRLARADGENFFESRIRPVLHERCIECHGAEKQKGGLRLDSREGMLTGGDSGPAIIPGNADESLLVKAVLHTDADLKMPPAKSGPKLPPRAIDDFAAWVKSGAVWPKGKSPSPSPAKEAFDLQARKQRLPWIWRVPTRQKVPRVAGVAGLGEIDRFVLAKLRDKELDFSPPADDLTWLRRVHFAIVGLPPRLEDIKIFMEDRSPERRERVVDGLLASPHYGERWARHWMDLMRYAESRGHESDFPIANAWRYRDYLIRAFNSDLPYDRFVSEHIAGDLISPRIDPATGANESVQATGWAFLGEEVHSPVDIRQDECERIDNKVDVLSKSFLGLTVACARCHDHKFDAITQRDYYALSGFILSSTFRQARFETMESHKRDLATLADLRARESKKLKAALVTTLEPELKAFVPEITGARRVLLGESTESVATSMRLDASRLSRWAEHLKIAAGDPAHPLHYLARAASSKDVEKGSGEWRGPANPSVRNDALPKDAKVLANYTGRSSTPWKSDGPGFGRGPLMPGDLVFGTPDRPVVRIMPHGAAVSDAFWNKLSLTPGTEMDSGRLGAAARAGRTLLTPTATLATGRLHYLIRGRSQVYAGVDSHLMVEGPLHGVLVSSFDTGRQLRWVTHDLSAYAGHRAHLEFSPIGESSLEVLMIVESEKVPNWLPVEPWRPREEPASFRAMAEAFRDDCARSLSFLMSGNSRGEPGQAVLANWMLENATSFGLNLEPVNSASSTYFAAQAELARKIRWDSPTAVSLADGTGVEEHVLIRGKPGRPAAIAPRRLPEAFGRPPVTNPDSSGRAELARELTEPSNPLVARVMVNRVWHHLFGRGIVPTVDNFGFLGERPSHPELLDHLAWQFVNQDGWSLKRMIRRMILTETFAQSSQERGSQAVELDPANILLHRMPVRRLEAEVIRDALLAVSGRLDPRAFGPPVPVHLTEFIVGRGRPDVSGPLDGAGRRSIYIAARRNFLPSMMVAFDYPTPFSTVGRRNVTNVPAQALVMMNDEFVRQQAGLWARRLLVEKSNFPESDRISWLFETGFGRLPTTQELNLTHDAIGELRILYSDATEEEIWSELCHSLVGSNDFIYVK